MPIQNNTYALLKQITSKPRTPFERYEQAALRRAVLARILRDTQEVVASYEHLEEVAREAGLDREVLTKMADDALIELTQAYETLTGGVE